ncbi:MAG: hypothetical protein MUC64_09015 [Rubritepida sp.]|nr:hypothetical protein [Rubritepida sp.]
MLPLGLVAALGQQVHAAHQVARVEVLRVDPRQQRHVVVLRAERHLHLARAAPVHLRQQPADEIGHQVRPQRPGGAEIAEHPDHVRHAREHHAAVGHGLVEGQRLAVDLEGDVAQHVEVKAGGGDDQVRLQLLAGLEQDALLREALDLAGDDARRSLGHRVEQVAVRHIGQALVPGAVARREVRGDVVVGADDAPHLAQQLGRHLVGLGHAALRQPRLLEEDLAAHDLMHPGLVHRELAQLVGDVDAVAPDAEPGGRALQHGHMRGPPGHGGHHRRRRRARADDDDPLARVVQVLGPGLRMDDLPLELGHAGPFGRVALGVAVVALAHVEEGRGEAPARARRAVRCFQCPELRRPVPGGAMDGVLVADVRGEAVVLDHLAQVFQDFRRARDRRADPGLEAVAEGVEVAVRADAGVFVRPPGAAEARLAFQHDEALAWHLRRQVVGGADARDAGADDQHVEMLGLGLCVRLVQQGGVRHGRASLDVSCVQGYQGRRAAARAGRMRCVR